MHESVDGNFPVEMAPLLRWSPVLMKKLKSVCKIKKDVIKILC